MASGGVGCRWILAVVPRLGANIGSVSPAASSGLFSSLEPRWASNVGVNSRGLFIPEHEGE
jgi:hypothetical protein